MELEELCGSSWGWEGWVRVVCQCCSFPALLPETKCEEILEKGDQRMRNSISAPIILTRLNWAPLLPPPLLFVPHLWEMSDFISPGELWLCLLWSLTVCSRRWVVLGMLEHTVVGKSTIPPCIPSLLGLLLETPQTLQQP